MERSLPELKQDLIQSSRRGYPILIAGALFLAFLGVAPQFFPMPTVHLIWIVGMGSIFPLGLMIAKALGIDLLATDNPLARVGGLAAGMQAFFIPVYIMVYQVAPVWLPFTVGLLGGSHFLIYYWLYESRAYLFLTLAMTGIALVAGGFWMHTAFTTVPLGLALVYVITVLLILRENTTGTR